MKKPFLAVLFVNGLLLGHPMGNFSVNHYANLRATAQGVDVHYTLDLAEIPTFDLLRQWQLERNSPPSELESKANQQAREWLKGLSFSVDGKPVQATFVSDRLTLADGAGNLPILRIAIRARIDAQGGKLAYEDRNYPDRTGWKEIVVDAAAGTKLITASQSNKDLSKALTQYPPDPAIAPPQDLRATLDWKISKPLGPTSPAPKIVKIPQPQAAPATSPAQITPAAAAPIGAVVRGDFLSKLLHQTEITPWMMFVALGAAFLLGAAHALTPGHGKSIVAAYLVGSRGTFKHALFLGAMVTFTHTISVFALGIATLFLFRSFVPETVTKVLSVISGLSIMFLGAWMLVKRARHAHAHAHGHHHHHNHHVPEDLSWGSLIALGASGGLVPCESALVLLLGAIALGRVGLGLLLLLSFSLGLAIVLMAIGTLVLYAKNLLPQRTRSRGSAFSHWVSIASPAIVTIVGVLMTTVSLGWIHPKWMIG